MPSKKKKKVPISVIPTNDDNDDSVELLDGNHVIASEIQIVEMAESSQVCEAD